MSIATASSTSAAVEAGESVSQEHKLTASDAAAGDEFGGGVAVSGDTAVVAAHRDDDAGDGSGSVYVFTRGEAGWVEEAKLTASDAAAGDFFGISVAVSGDTIVVGSFGDDLGGGDYGSAYVFARGEAGWVEEAKLTRSDGDGRDFFGASVAVSGDTVVVGAYGDDDAGLLDSGSAYVFTRGGTGWVEEAKLMSSDPVARAKFGSSVGVSDDTIVAGAHHDRDFGDRIGSAYVFTRGEAGWIEEAELKAAGAATDDFFGISVAVSGGTIVVGAHGNDDAGTGSGSAYVFSRDGAGWVEEAKLNASDDAAEDEFGISVAVSGDTAVVGAQRDDDAGSSSGSAYVFTRGGAGWVEEAKLAASDASADDALGRRVAVSGDTAVVGAYRDDDAGESSGSAYVFGAGVRCDGQTATHVGTDSGETLTGTAGDDVFVAMGGADTIVGGGGNDVVCAGDGDDIVNTGAGTDRVFGGGGDDDIRTYGGDDYVGGGDGNDTVRSGAAADIIDAGAGVDNVIAGGGADTIDGGPGADSINGGAGIDTIRGSGGNDTLRGQGNNDTVNAGPGDDVVRGHGGNDTLNGNSGNDTLLAGSGDDVLNGGNDDDTLWGSTGIDMMNGGTGVDFCDGGGDADPDTANGCENTNRVP